MKTVKLLLLFPLLLNFYLANAQYVGQINNASTLYNPSFVGSKNALRVASGVNTTQYNIIWFGKPNTAFNLNSFLAADLPIKKISGAIGFSVANNTMSYPVNDIDYIPYVPYQRDNYIETEYNYNFTYAQIFTVRNENKEEIISLRPAITYYKNIFQFSDLTKPKTEKLENFKSDGFILSMLFTGKKYFAGFKQELNLSKMNQDKFAIGNFHLIGGYDFKFSNFSITPLIELQPYNNNLITKNKGILKCSNLNFKYKKIIWGLNYSIPNHNYYENYNKGLMIGYQNEKLRLCSSIIHNNKYGISGELIANYIFKKK